MDAVFVRSGDVIDHTPSGSAVDAGDVVVVGDTVAIAKSGIADGAAGVLSISGAFLVPKATGSSTAIAAGKKVYWNAGLEVATETSGSNKVMGHTLEAAGDDDDAVLVKLAQV